jgi:hypothetical protein
MVKKSRKVASRYSQLSKEGKKRQRNRLSPQPRAASTLSAQEPVGEGARATRAAPRTVPRPSHVAAKPLAGYEYVRDDLRRIGILSGAAVVILVVLTFVLG